MKEDQGKRKAVKKTHEKPTAKKHVKTKTSNMRKLSLIERKRHSKTVLSKIEFCQSKPDPLREIE